MFSKEINRICSQCSHSSNLQDASHVLCKKKGVVASGYSCRKFAYDPLKREPKRISVLNGFSPDDFKIE